MPDRKNYRRSRFFRAVSKADTKSRSSTSRARQNAFNCTRSSRRSPFALADERLRFAQRSRQFHLGCCAAFDRRRKYQWSRMKPALALRACGSGWLFDFR
jgi:hypothetical protein